MEYKKDFLLIKNHTDEEISLFLQRKLEEGWWLTATKGNSFLFQKKSSNAKKVCCLTVAAKDLGEGADEACRRAKKDLQEQGWITFLTGDLENLRDSQRHLFLYSEDGEAIPPEAEEKARKGREKARLLKSLSNVGISLVYAIFLRFVFRYYDAVGNVTLFIFGFLPLVVLIPTLLSSLFAVFYAVKEKKDSTPKKENKLWRMVDHSTRLSSLMLILFAVYLVLDVLIRGL